MGLFGNAQETVIIEEVENATSDKLVEENWQKIINICDKAGRNSEDARACLRAIVKRLYNSDPHIGTKAVTLLDACVKNSGKVFHVEVASREFENDFMKLMVKAPAVVAKKLRESLKRWSENEFKSDGQLSLIPSLYHKLRAQYDFASNDTPVKKRTPKTTDPNVVESQEEEEQILKAIELSLKETTGSPKAVVQTSTSLYPSVNNISTYSASSTQNTPAKELRKVRALYDFEAAEDNELTFSSGEIIMVLDDSDPNWWKGANQRGEGLFPANFVTADLTVEPEKFLLEKAKKMVQFKEEVKVEDKEPEGIEINEDKIDRLLHLLHEADPTNPETDTDELLSLEREVNAMGPLIDTELERVDRKHAQLTQLSADLVESVGLYHSLMREPQFSTMPKSGFQPIYGYMPPMANMQYTGGMPMSVPPQNLQRAPMGGMMPVPRQYVEEGRNVYSHPQPSFPDEYQMYGSLPASATQMPHNVQMQGTQGPSQPSSAIVGPQRGGPVPHHSAFTPVLDERMMGQFPQGNRGPNYAMPQPAPFQTNGHPSQTSLQNPAPNQQPHYVTSSSHLMH